MGELSHVVLVFDYYVSSIITYTRVTNYLYCGVINLQITAQGFLC